MLLSLSYLRLFLREGWETKRQILGPKPLQGVYLGVGNNRNLASHTGWIRLQVGLAAGKCTGSRLSTIRCSRCPDPVAGAPPEF